MTNNITKEQLIEQHHEQHKQRQLKQQQQSLLSRQPPSPHRLQQQSAHEALLLSQLQHLRQGIADEQYVNNSKDGMISNCHQWPRERVNEHGYPVTTNNSIHTTTTGSSGNISTKYGELPKQKKQKKRQRRGRKRTNSHHNDDVVDNSQRQYNSGESSAENNSKVPSQLDSYLRYRAISTGDRPAGTDSVSRELSNDGSSVYRNQQSFILQRQRLHQRRSPQSTNDFVYHSDLYNNEQQNKQSHYNYGNSEACINDGSFNSSQDYSLPRRGSTVQYSDRGSSYSNQSGTTKTSSLAESSIGDCYTTTSNRNSWTKRSDLYLFISISHLITIIYLATSTSSSNEGINDSPRSSREVANIILSSISFFISITIGMGCYYLPFQGYMTTSTSSSLPSKSQRKRSEYYEYLYSSMQSLELSSSNGSSINTRFNRLRSNVTLEQILVVLTFILTSVNCGLILYPTHNGLAVDDEGEQEVTATGNGQVWNATLFCSLWASLYGCAYNLMIVLTQSDGNKSRRRDFIQRLWLMSVFSSTCAYITLFIVYSRSACDGQYLNGTLYCTSAFMGGFFNVGCSLLSVVVGVYLLRTSKKMRSGYYWTQSTRLQWLNLACATILLGVSSTNVAYISRPSGGSGDQVGNVFVTSWSTWIISVILWRKSIGLLIASSYSATLPVSAHDTDKSVERKRPPTYARYHSNAKLEDSMRSGDVTHGTSIDDSERSDYTSISSSATSILVPEEDKRVQLDPEEQPTYHYQDNGDIIVDFHGQAASPSQSLVRQASQEYSMGEETDCSYDSLQEKVDALKLNVQLICQETVSSLGTGNTTLSSSRDGSISGSGLYNLDTSSRSPRAVPCMSPQELLQVELDAITGKSRTTADRASAQEKMYSMVYPRSSQEEDQQEDKEVVTKPEAPTLSKLIQQPSDRRRSLLTESWRSNLSPLQEATSSEEGSSAAPNALPKRRARSKSKKKKMPSNNSKSSSTYKGSRRQTPPPPPPRPTTPTRLRSNLNPSYGEKKPNLGSNESKPKTTPNKTSDGSSTKPAELSSGDKYLTKRMSTEETQLLSSYANTESESPPACSSVSTSSSDFDIVLNDQNSSQSGITEPSVYDKYGVKDGLVLPLKSKEAMKVALKHAAATHSAKQAKMKKPTRQLRQSESSQSDMAKSVEALLSKYAMSCMNAHDMSTNAIDDSYRLNNKRSGDLRTSAGVESVCSASRKRSKSEDTTGLTKKEESTLESTCSITRSRSSHQLSTSSTSRYSSIDTSVLENHKPSSKGGISSSDEVSSACDSEVE